MKNNKGSLGLVIGITIGVLVLIGVIVLILVLNHKGVFKPKQEPMELIPFFIAPRLEPDLNFIESNYILEYQNVDGNFTYYSQGKLDDSWNELNVPRDFRLGFSCWSDQTYLVRAYKDILPEEKAQNKSKFTCDMVKFGNITVIHEGEIKSTRDQITLNISTGDWFYKTGMCFAWTSGILDVGLKDQFVFCDSGSWKNWSSYDAEKRKFTYLPKGKYLCGEDQYQECIYVDGSKCKIENEEIPSRFKGKVDSCVYTGKTIHNQTVQFVLDIQSDFKDRLDYIDIYIYDRDRRKNPNTGEWEWVSELDGKDIGSPDAIYRINYQEEGGCSENACSL